jgi:hypothetical protein
MQLESYLQQSSRLGLLKRLEQSRVRELLFLISMGVLAAVLSAFVKTHLRIPGNAILKVVLPISFGFAAVPKRYSGSVMGFSALCCGLILRGGMPGGGDGVGAFTSLVLFGPVLDICLRSVFRPISAWFLLALAGLATNAGAFLVRGSFKFLGRDDAAKRLLADWFSAAMVSYTVCGLLAGLICGMMFFRYQPAADEKN